jgi:hypothetical protein
VADSRGSTIRQEPGQAVETHQLIFIDLFRMSRAAVVKR